MPTAGKVFVSTEYMPLADISVGLEGFREEDSYQEGDVEIDLVTEIANLSIDEGMLTGLYSYDYVVHNYHRGKVLPSPATKEVLFAFTELEERVFLAAVQKKSKKHGHTVGLVRDGSVTLFNSVDQGQYLNYLKEEILSMTQPPRMPTD